MKNLVSIIINCKNGRSFLKKSISSVILQTYKNWEIIFFDNCSSDSSILIAKSFKDKRIKIFKANKSLKLYDARNQAIKYAKGKYITFLDTDDFWGRRKLTTQINFLNKKKIKILLFKFKIKV